MQLLPLDSRLRENDGEALQLPRMQFHSVRVRNDMVGTRNDTDNHHTTGLAPPSMLIAVPVVKPA